MIRTRRETVGKHQLIRGDSGRVLKRLAKGSVDVIITSPPYNIGLGYRSYKDRLSEEEYLSWMEEICSLLHRILNDKGSFFLNIAGSSTQPWLPFELVVRLRKFFILQNHISWVKSIAVKDVTHGHFKPINSKRYLNRNHEHIFHLTKMGDVPLRRVEAGVPFTDKSNINRRQHEQDKRCRGDTWFLPYETVRSKEGKFSHPGTFPVSLPLTCLQLHGVRPDLTVLDPFMGTGTTLVAAEKLGLQAIGIEADTAYVKIARERLRELVTLDQKAS
ncbi:site-specific DNA-methyltransferase [Aristophania vespae]|uniref:Methyltransferase n=1 Tax=Aristophania vespae TaxID=2697033 RepID=A0A6P1ND51_9PROT|nr:site-specific DNA-methyltransferase [Aristophania vespae]QHI95389.1 site-specific DNA-methyltransferase [Aristophania vespae]UMM64665.1 DNA adenine methyltransferase YhdJ [Aristophania vespae]